jgi:hypothetical protein
VISEEIGNVELKLKLPVETDAEGRWDQFLSNNPFLITGGCNQCQLSYGATGKSNIPDYRYLGKPAFIKLSNQNRLFSGWFLLPSNLFRIALIVSLGLTLIAA